MDNELKLEDFISSLFMLWRKKWLIICATVLAGLCGLLVTFNSQPVNLYEAHTTVYSISTDSATQSSSLSGMLSSYANIITSNKVTERAASLLGGNIQLSAGAIRNMLYVQQVDDYITRINAIHVDPQTAVLVANAVAESFIIEVASITGNNSVRILDSAQSAGLRYSEARDLLMKRVLFALVGFALSCLYVIWSALSSDKVRTIAQCMDDDPNEIIGIVPLLEQRLLEHRMRINRGVHND